MLTYWCMRIQNALLFSWGGVDMCFNCSLSVKSMKFGMMIVFKTRKKIPANFFWDISMRFLSWECWDFWRRHDHFRRFPKKSEVFRRRPKSAEGEVFTCFSLQKSEIARKVLSFIHFTHGFRSLHGSELTYFWKLCQARRQQLTFFSQAWEIGPQAWDQSFQPAGVRVGRYRIWCHRQKVR